MMHRTQVYSGEDLDQWRLDRRLSRRQLATLMNIHIDTLARWCKLPHLVHHRRWMPVLLHGVEHQMRSITDNKKRGERVRAQRAVAYAKAKAAAEKELDPTVVRATLKQ